MSTPLPSDFPDLDMEAWRKALPMPSPQSPTPNLDRIVNEVFASLPQHVHDAIFRLAETPPKPEPPLVLGSDTAAPRPPKVRRHPK